MRRMLSGFKFFAGIGVAAILFLASGQITPAQTIVTGELAGTVKDTTGGAIPNNTVTAKSDATGETRTAATNSSGEYHFSLLRPGTYTLSASASGFQPTEVNATVTLGQINTYNIVLGVQQRTESVEVTVAEPVLQTENANVSTSFNPLQIQDLPVGGNDMTAFVFTTPGTTASTGGGYGSFSAAGLPATANLFTINGTDNMDPYLSVNNSGASNLTLGSNEIQEAAVVSNAYGGQYGRHAGTQVNYVTKSGSNEFHGNGYWDWNGSKLDANDWFNNASSTARPHEVNNAWAGSVGGPILKNKLFFFADQEGLRYVLPGGGQPIYIPTTAFSNYVLAHVTPSAVPFYTQALKVYGGAPAAPTARLLTLTDDQALGCGDFAGGGFGPGGLPCAETFQNTANSLNTEWLINTRVDFDLTDRDRFYFRFGTDHGVQATSTDPINVAFSANSVQPQWGGQAGYTRTISANSVNELLVSGFYYKAVFGPPNLAAALAIFPTTFQFTDGLYTSMAGVSPNTLSAYPSGRRVAQWQIVDDYSYIHGAHEFKFGVNFRRNYVADLAYGVQTSGLLTFASMTDFVNGTLVHGSTYIQNFTRIGPEHIDLYNVGIYGQDQWKISPKLTLTLALRLDRSENPACAAKCYAGLNSTFENLAHGASIPYNSSIQVGMSRAFRGIDPIVPQPRVGVAYSLDNKTVLRGGFGLFSDDFAGTLNNRFFTNTPNVASFTTPLGSGLVAAPGVANSAFANVAASNTAFQNGFANGATLASLTTALQSTGVTFAVPNLYTQADEFHLPRYAEWNLEVQRELTSTLVLDVNYVGNHGWDEINQNPYPNAYSTTGFGGLPTTAPDPRFGEILELSSTGHSNYAGLTSSLKWRFQSFLGQINYTWGHALDTCSNNCLTRFNLLTSPSFRYDYNPVGASGSYGNADYDVRHSLGANYLWTIPTHFGNAALKSALGGWTIGGTFQARSGYPFTVMNSSLRSAYVGNSSGIGTLSIPADWLGGSASMSCTVPNVPCFKSTQFGGTPTQVMAGKAGAVQTDFGNTDRNMFRGPRYFDTDMTINKNISLTERYHLIIGANFFNLLNHPNFDLPVNSTTGALGTINSTVSPFSSPYGSFEGSAASGRIVQMTAKFQF